MGSGSTQMLKNEPHHGQVAASSRVSPCRRIGASPHIRKDMRAAIVCSTARQRATSALQIVPTGARKWPRIWHAQNGQHQKLTG
jgi:hypothetical protein